MKTVVEYCDPFNSVNNDIWMKLEHCGRYIFARDYLSDKGCQQVLDLACANGYGSSILSQTIPSVISCDKNKALLKSHYFASQSIKPYCFDFDDDYYPLQTNIVDGIVCFETIEHLKKPYQFIDKITRYLISNGFLILSFPNSKYEKYNSDGTNKDPYHLHTFELEDILNRLKMNGNSIINVLGQPLCNNLYSKQRKLEEEGCLIRGGVENAFNYDHSSIMNMSRLMAYPQNEDIENSYSYIIIAQSIY